MLLDILNNLKKEKDMNDKSKSGGKLVSLEQIIEQLNLLLLASIKVGASQEFIRGIENSINSVKRL